VTTRYPLDTFDGIFQMQANGVVTTPAESPNGIPGRLEIVGDPLGQRGNVLRATVFDTDPETSLGQRAEIRLENMNNGEYWWQWNMMLDIVPDTGQPIVINQVHKADLPAFDATEPWLMDLTRRHLQVKTPATAMLESYAVRLGPSMPAELNRWYQMTLHMILEDSGPTGMREFFLDGVLVQRETGVITEYLNNQGYLKLGFYDYAGTGDFGQMRGYFSDLVLYTGPMSPNSIMDVRPPKSLTIRPSPGMPV